MCIRDSSNEFVSGTVECLSCGALQFYKMTNDEARAVTEMHSAKTTDDAESMKLDMEAKAKAEVEAAELLKDEMNRFRGQAYRQTHRSSVEHLMRQRVRKQHVHRWTWNSLTTEGKKYREEKGLAGYVAVSASAARTSPWNPSKPDDVPVGEVAVAPQDVVYYMLSMIMDDTGAPQKGEQLRESTGKLIADTLISVLVDHDFEVVLEHMMGDIDKVVNWLRGVYQSKKKSSRDSAPKRLFDDIEQYWKVVRDALVATQANLSGYQLKCMRALVDHELKWRGRRGVERGGGGRAVANFGVCARR